MRFTWCIIVVALACMSACAREVATSTRPSSPVGVEKAREHADLYSVHTDCGPVIQYVMHDDPDPVSHANAEVVEALEEAFPDLSFTHVKVLAPTEDAVTFDESKFVNDLILARDSMRPFQYLSTNDTSIEGSLIAYPFRYQGCGHDLDGCADSCGDAQVPGFQDCINPPRAVKSSWRSVSAFSESCERWYFKTFGHHDCRTRSYGGPPRRQQPVITSVVPNTHVCVGRTLSYCGVFGLVDDCTVNPGPSSDTGPVCSPHPPKIER